MGLVYLARGSGSAASWRNANWQLRGCQFVAIKDRVQAIAALGPFGVVEHGLESRRGRAARSSVDPCLAARLFGPSGASVNPGSRRQTRATQDPEPRPAIVKPPQDRLSREDVKFLEEPIGFPPVST